MNLPQCDLKMSDTSLFNHVQSWKRTFSVDNGLEYEKLIVITQDLIDADCHAIVVNEEVLYNSYSPKPLKEKIIEDLIRTRLSEQIHKSVFSSFLRSKNKNQMKIYMFGEFPFCVIIDFSKTFILSASMSESYKKRFLN